MRPTLIALCTIGLALPASADEPVPGASPPVEPPPPAVAASGLPEGVTPIADQREVTFVLSGGTRVTGRRIGEDPEFFWIEANGRRARVRKSDIATMDFQGRAATRTPPPATPPATPPPPAGSWNAPPLGYTSPAPRAPPGRSMVVWGSIMLGGGYTLAIARSLEDTPGDDSSNVLLAIPIVGPFLFAATESAGGDEGAIWVLDGLVQAGGTVLLFLGVQRMMAGTRTRERRQRTPFLGLSLGPRHAFASAAWIL